MSLTDLQQMLRERSADPAGQVIHDLRLRGVRAKVAARRRRRRTVIGVGATTVLAVAFAVVPRGGETPPVPADAPSVRMIEGFREYANGARVIAASSADLAAGRIELTVIPETADLVIFTRCRELGGSGVETAVTVNRRPSSAGRCGSGTSTRPEMADLDVVAGQPATFVMTADSEPGSELVGTFGLAIGERVPFADYPLPPRPPGELGRLDEVLPAGCTEETCPGTLIIRSDPADPARPVRRTVTWRTLDSIDMVAQTPGFLHVRVAGVPVVTGEWWDYERSGYGTFGDAGGRWSSLGVDPEEGDRVTIEIVPEHITGAWQVVLTPADVAD